MQAHGLRILDRDVAETAHARDHNPLAGPRLRLFQTLVGGNTGAENRRGINERQFVWNAPQVICLAQRILSEAAVYGITRHLLLRTERFPTSKAEFTMPAGAVQPCDSDAVAFLQMGDARAQLGYEARAFMSGCKGQSWFDRPIAIRRVQVGMTDTARDDLDQCLSRPWIWNWNFSNLQWLAEFIDECRFHCFRHSMSPLESTV